MTGARYDVDAAEPVYPERFHRPKRRVKAGDLESVLAELQRVAKESDARPLAADGPDDG